MIEGPGHVPMQLIKENMDPTGMVRRSAVLHLGPLTTDIAPGYDHITSAHRRGADWLVWHGDAVLRHPERTPGLPNKDDVKEGIMAQDRRPRRRSGQRSSGRADSR